MSVSQLLIGGDELAQLAEALARPRLASSVFGAIESIAARRMPLTVFSVSRCLLASTELERVYTSLPDVYAVGARKSKRETSWAQHVLRDRKVFVGEGPLEMAAAFDDQERMGSIGVRSIINVPMVVADRCVGVLAFGRSAERVPPEEVLLARFFGLAAVAAFVDAKAERPGGAGNSA